MVFSRTWCLGLNDQEPPSFRTKVEENFLKSRRKISKGQFFTRISILLGSNQMFSSFESEESYKTTGFQIELAKIQLYPNTVRLLFYPHKSQPQSPLMQQCCQQPMTPMNDDKTENTALNS